MTALYEITDQYKQILALDDIPEEQVIDTLECIKDDFNDKALNVAAYFQNVAADIDAMKDAEKRIAGRRKTLENKVARLKEYLLFNMQATGISKIECPEFRISLRNNPSSVHVIDESLIPSAFKRTVSVLEVDKVAIKQAGGCDGVELIRKQSLSIK